MSDIEKKKALYRQIVESTPEQVLLERMKALGFWPTGEPAADDPPDEAKEAAELELAIARLRAKASVAGDPEKALAAERVRRWKASKERRAKGRAGRLLDAKARREAWEKAKAARGVVSVGEGVSAGLEGAAVGSPRPGLPPLPSPSALAEALGIDMPTLRWLTYHRASAALVHYHRFTIPKKTGEARHISAPKPKLARAQRWVLREILEKVDPSAEAHGFVRGRSVKSNADPHVGRAVVLNLDLEGFFPSIGWRRVKGLFHRGLGYPEPVAVLLAMLCTEPARAEASLDGQPLFVAVGERVLPQGACTSPAITNLLCRRLDRRLVGFAAREGFVYTRYADDLTFSGEDRGRVGRLLAGTRRIVRDEGFVVNEAKTRVMPRARAQEVTGVTVNAKSNVGRRERRALRALLYNAKREGLESQNREGHPCFREHLRGRIAWVSMLDPAQGAKLRAMLEEIPR